VVLALMVLHGFVFGHLVFTRSHLGKWAGKPHTILVWHWKDTGERVTLKSTRERRCPKCKKRATALGHDPCIANLPGVVAACCGHGVEEAYVMFSKPRRITIRGKFDR
jgi:hypothetical protein